MECLWNVPIDRGRNCRTVKTKQSGKSRPFVPGGVIIAMDTQMKIGRWGGGAGLLVCVIGALVGLYFLVSSKDIDLEIRLPVLAIAGVVALLISLAVVAGSFTLFGLTNRNEALGLPEGSARAVIALSLIVLFAIFSVYLYADLSRPPIAAATNLTGSDKDRLLSAIPSTMVIATVSNHAQGPEERFSVYYQQGNAQGQDFAKQLLAMIGTLVTSVSSFYFGSKAVTAAVPSGGSKPAAHLRGVTPKGHKSGQTVSLTIEGDNLDLVKEVKIAHANRQVVAKNVTSNANTVLCELDIPANAPAGAWTVSVVDGAGQKADLVDAFTISHD